MWMAEEERAREEELRLCQTKKEGPVVLTTQECSGMSRGGWHAGSKHRPLSPAPFPCGHQDTVKQNPGKVEQDLSGTSERDRCPNNLLFCPASQR